MPYANGHIPKSPQARAFGETLRTIRQRRKRSQEDLAEKVGLSQQTMAAWENGVTVPKPDEIFNLEERLRLDPGELSRFFGFIPLPQSIRP